MKAKFITGLALATAISAAPLQAADYVIDTQGAHASIQFRISHLGTSWLIGRFNTFNGTFSYDAENPEASQVKVDVDVTSIDSNHAERDKHLRGDKYLNTGDFPAAKFESTSFTPDANGGGVMKGMLTLYGNTQEIAIQVAKVGEGQDPWGNYRAGFSGTTEIKAKDFGLNYNLGPAAETVYLDLNIEGIRQ
ncbi:YceI family protein [Neptuniibacter halophilus]|uniref:YceI family protein n=1 Tax=Neptuniibacter halophilus TaxID=651666 RepID=UPI00257482A3|nr:YceI family protein [Neptuniibacter halophilus]